VFFFGCFVRFFLGGVWVGGGHWGGGEHKQQTVVGGGIVGVGSFGLVFFFVVFFVDCVGVHSSDWPGTAAAGSSADRKRGN